MRCVFFWLLNLTSLLLHCTVRTFIDTVAETTLVAATSINKLHVGTHVGLASIAADRAGLTVVHNVERSLQGHIQKGH